MLLLLEPKKEWIKSIW